MIEIEKLQPYLEELASQRETPGDEELQDGDPSLIALVHDIAHLTHPPLPSEVDTRYQAHLSAIEQQPATTAKPAPGKNTGDNLQQTLADFSSWLRTRFMSLRLAGGLALAAFILIFCAGSLLVTLLISNRQTQTARVAMIEGKVERLTENGWVPLELNDSIHTGQRLRTGASGSATLRFFEGTQTTLTAATDAVLTTVDGGFGKMLQVTWTQLEGETSHEVVPLRGRDAYYIVETPGGSVNVQGTEFTIAVQPTGLTRVNVTEGQVAMTGAGETVSIQTGQATVSGPGQAPFAPAYQFAGQGEITGIAGTVWTISHLPVTVISQTVIIGNPTVGDFVSVTGRVLSGNMWLADVISIAPPGASTFSFTAPIESIGPNFWQIGAVTVAVTGQTQLIGNLELGTLAQVTFTVLTDGTLIALIIEEIGAPPPTPTATATFTTTVTATATATATTTPTMTPVPPIILNCYQITFLGVEYHPDNSSTWSYHVAELPCAQDLSNWMVALPSCTLPLAAAPTPWEYVNPDPNYHLTGVKWEVEDEFEQGVFTVTLTGHWAIGTTLVGVKGPDVAIGVMAGPICIAPSPTPTPSGSVTPSVTPTHTPTFTPTPTILATATPTLTATPQPTFTRVPPTSTPVPPPPPTQPPPPPPGGGSYTINENNQTQTLTCNGHSVTINGNNNSITLRGNCGSVTVRGNNNWVSGLHSVSQLGDKHGEQQHHRARVRKE